MSTVVVDAKPAASRWRAWLGTQVAGGRLRLAAAAAIVVVAYRTSLVTLLEVLQLDTPIAHLALVPPIAIGLAWWARRSSAGPDIHDRQFDWIVGMPLLAIAVAMNWFLPQQMSWEYWAWRIDLLSLPLFVAGLVALLFGVRALWKYRLAVSFLVLAWPYPYQRALDRWLGALTDLTISGVAALARPTGLAEQVAGSTSLFEVGHRGELVRMNIASACSGANGLVGFLLVGTALMFTVTGSRRRKLVWLGVGAVLVLVVNLGRILIIFWTARQWGGQVALEGFHPVAGLVVFNVAIVVMVLLMRPFGLRFGRPANEIVAGDPVAAPAGQHLPRRPVAAYASVAMAFTLVAVANSELRDYDRVSSSIGAPQLEAFGASRETPAGWTLSTDREITGYERFFGEQSTWTRYRYYPMFDPSAPLRASIPITADVIQTPNRAALSNYGVEECYEFHGYDLAERGRVELGSGVSGGFITWTNHKNEATWTSLYWHWPIQDGRDPSYERITLIMQDRPANTFAAPGLPAAEPGTGSGDDDETEHRLDRQRRFMIEFARDLVRQRVTDT